MSIQEILRRERAPKEKAVAKAKAEHDKAAAAAKKMETAAKTAYDAKCAEAKKLVDQAAEGLKAAEGDLVEFDAQVKSFPTEEAATQKKGAAKGKVAAAPKGKPGPKPGAKKTAAPKAAAAPKAVAAPKGKPGPKPGAKKAAAPKGKPGPKPGAKKAAAPAAKKAAAKPAATRPPIKDACRLVMGRKTLPIKDVVAGLQAQKWVPDTTNLTGYVSAILSGTKNVFEAVGRGVYRVKGDAPPIKAEVKAHFGDAVKASQAEPAQVAATPAPKGRKKAEPKAAASSEKKHGQHKCKTCQEPGHNAKGHDKWIAKKAAAEAKTKPADPPAAEPKAAPAAPAKKAAASKSVDDILAAEASQGAGLSAEMESAFGN